MRKHDQKLPDLSQNNRGGVQYRRLQQVTTPIGVIQIPCAIRIPKKRASKRQWLIWFERFKPLIRIEPFWVDNKPKDILDNMIDKYRTA